MTSLRPFLPAVLVFGGSATGCLVEGGQHEDMPRFKQSGTVLVWPGRFIMKYDTAVNEAGELLVQWLIENKDQKQPFVLAPPIVTMHAQRRLKIAAMLQTGRPPTKPREDHSS